MTDLFKNLNREQKKAVLCTKGPSLVLAGAGSGKTKILISKVVYLILRKKIPQASILMITFTNKAAAEMKERIRKIFSHNPFKQVGFIGTFHSFCAFILRRSGYHIGINHDFIIYDEDDQIRLIKHILQKKNIDKFTPYYFLNRISAAKNQLLPHAKYCDFFSDYNASLIANVYTAYQNELRKNNAVDFDDLLVKVIELFMADENALSYFQDKYKYILVDEFQDTNYAQYILIKMIGQKYENITVVGDFSQSIYSWRGADIKNLEKFRDDFPHAKTFYLEENYRSTKKILEFANSIISQNAMHPILNLYTKKSEGKDVIIRETENEQYESFFIISEIEKLQKNYSLDDFSVLYRTNAQSRILEESFIHSGIPYILIGGVRFYERKEIKDILSYLRLLTNPSDKLAEERIAKLGKKRWKLFENFCTKERKDIKNISTADLLDKLFQKTGYLTLYNPNSEEDYARLENIKELKSVAMAFPEIHNFLERVALVESEYFEGEKGKKKNGVRLMTLHQAKGLEFPIVFITGVEDGILPHSRSIDDQFALEEERRLFYVGITRAKEYLYISYARNRFIFGRRLTSIRSRFLENSSFELL